MARPTTNDAAVSDRLVTATVDLLGRGRPGDISVRAVAAAAGASTTAIYSLFGDKDGLVKAAIGRAAADLHTALEQAGPGDDPRNALLRLGLAYLDWARDHPHLYAAMFSGGRTYTPRGEAAIGDPAEPLMRAIGRAVRAGAITGPPALVAATFWAALHGQATLVADGAIDADTASTSGPALIRALIRGWAR